jgi:hypothetical protein
MATHAGKASSSGKYAPTSALLLSGAMVIARVIVAGNNDTSNVTS